MPPRPAMKDTFQRKLRRTSVCAAIAVSDKVSSYSARRLLFHDTILKARRQPAAGSLDHAERECLRHKQRRDAFPRLRHGIDPDGKQLVGRFVILFGDK